jgi:polyhydroxyalkanoate synthesis regulator phasin
MRSTSDDEIEMRRTTKIAIATAGAVALVVAGGGAALAASDVFSPEDQSKAIIDDAAKQLGVEPSELSDALKQALENRIDEAVAEGRLTKEQAQELKKRLDSADTPLLFPLFPRFGVNGHGPGHGHFGPFAGLDTAASYLGLSEAELRSRLADGKSLADVAKEEGKSVDGLVPVLVKAANERIDAAVDDGKLTESQAKDLKAGLEERIRDLVNREPGTLGPFDGRHRFGHGPLQHGFYGRRFGVDGPTPFAGPRA